MDSVIELGERNRSPQQSLVPGEEWDFDIVSNTTLGLPNHPGNEARNESSLAPVDTGFGAWAFLAAAFFVEALVWGFPNAFGVFLDSYLKDSLLISKPNASTLLPLIGPLSSGLIYCAGPAVRPLMSRFPKHRRTSMWVGLVVCFASLFGASFATEASTLVALQGVLYGIGGALLYHPCISFMSEWFVECRGLANGVIFAGTAAGGLVLPLFLPRLINAYGSQKTLRYISIGNLILLIPALPFIKPRLPNARARGPGIHRARNWSWLKERTSWFLLLANTVQGLAYFIPIVWLPTFASSLGLTSSDSSLALSVLNGASILGRVSMGVLSDKINPSFLAICTLSCTSLATFVIWGAFSNSLAGLLAFAVVYGGFASGWSSLYTGFVSPIAKDDLELSATIFGFLMLSRGIGNVLSTPISSALQDLHSSSTLQSSSYQSGFNVAGGRYEGMILYVGSCFAGAAVIVAIGWGVESWKGRQRNHASS